MPALRNKHFFDCLGLIDEKNGPAKELEGHKIAKIAVDTFEELYWISAKIRKISRKERAFRAGWFWTLHSLEGATILRGWRAQTTGDDVAVHSTSSPDRLRY